MVVGPALPNPRTYAEVTATGSNNNTGASARHQRNKAGVSPPVRHASDQGRLHENSPSYVNRGQRSDDMRATGGEGEGEGNFTRALHATPPDINRDRDTAIPLCEAGPSLIGSMAQGEGRGEKESPGRDAVDHTSESLTSQPSRGGGRGGGK
ncbi:hypothetical protein ACOMHN_046079 [Nucella lapillus]